MVYDEGYKMLDAMGLSSQDKAELDAYILKGCVSRTV